MKRLPFGYILLLINPCLAFLVSPQRPASNAETCQRILVVGRRRHHRLQATLPDREIEADDVSNDAHLLQSVRKQQLVDLCQQMNLSTTGNKAELLGRLRAHAAAQVQASKARRLDRVRRVEEGYEDDPKERHEIVTSPLDITNDEDDEEEEDFVFYYAPDAFPTSEKQDDKKSKETTTPKKKTHLSQAVITAPPPPLEPNENGERVVQVYSTTDQNDLTGIAAAQPGHSAMSMDTLTNAAPPNSASQPWDQQNTKATSSKEEDKAKMEINELVQTLLSMTGLPAFYFGDDDDDDDETMANNKPPLTRDSYKGFDPTRVPTDLLLRFSQSLRTGRGALLQDVLRQYELQAIGQDGMHGDNVQSGGGHYREVSKVRAFLEGYRRAEVRRIARETTTMLLDKLVTEGIEGLDMTLATMTRSSDDTSDHGGELNDSLLEYLNDAIRQQEKKVDKLVAERLEQSDQQLNGAAMTPSTADHDALANLWNVTVEEDGQRTESLDPNDPRVKAALEEELVREEISHALALDKNNNKVVPDSAPEQLLLLLTLLRERIKAEAVFAPDEKGRNLRLLAYCLQLPAETERRQLMSKELGTSIDRFDSFIELVSSSVEYGESTSYQLQPAKTKKPLNIRELRSILTLANQVRDELSRRASGFK